MIHTRCALSVLVAVLASTLSPGQDVAAQRTDDRKPRLSLKATPPLGYTPLKVRFTVDVRGGADDAADFYCPSIEWDWGDDLTSESSEDCAPHQPGKSVIRRRDPLEHTVRDDGNFSVRFRMKQNSRVVASTSVNVTVRGGARDDGEL